MSSGVARNFQGRCTPAENLFVLRMVFLTCAPLQAFFLEGGCPCPWGTPPWLRPWICLSPFCPIKHVFIHPRSSCQILRHAIGNKYDWYCQEKKAISKRFSFKHTFMYVYDCANLNPEVRLSAVRTLKCVVQNNSSIILNIICKHIFFRKIAFSVFISYLLVQLFTKNILTVLL
jgi:hypothetical protein